MTQNKQLKLIKDSLQIVFVPKQNDAIHSNPLNKYITNHCQLETNPTHTL